MKFRIFGLVMTAVMLLVCFSFSYSPLNTEENNRRYHQHKEALAYTPCAGHNDDVFCSHLPLVVIDTQNQEIPGVPIGEVDQFGEDVYTTAKDGSDYINVKVSVIDNDIESKGNNHLTDKPDFTTRSLFRIRGHASRYFEKSPYLMKFVDDDGNDRDISVMGMGAHHEWTLHGPYLDKSLVRNYMWYNISGELMNYAPNVRFCEVFLNGDYRGVYVMTETITNGENCRLKLVQTFKGNDIRGWLLRIDSPTDKDLETTRDVYTFSERIGLSGGDIAVRYPGKTQLTDEMAKEIELDVSAFEKSLYSYDHDTEDYGYWNWIDVDDFVDYYIINEFTENQDAITASTYIYRETDKKINICVWDFNNSCDNFPNYVSDGKSFLFPTIGYYRMLFMDEAFVQKVIDRYNELRKTYLSDEYITNYINETIDWLGPAVERNYKRWSNAFAANQLKTDKIEKRDRNQHSTKEAVLYMQNWLKERGEWMDKHIDALQYYSHLSSHKRWEH